MTLIRFVLLVTIIVPFCLTSPVPQSWSSGSVYCSSGLRAEGFLCVPCNGGNCQHNCPSGYQTVSNGCVQGDVSGNNSPNCPPGATCSFSSHSSGCQGSDCRNYAGVQQNNEFPRVPEFDSIFKSDPFFSKRPSLW